MQTTKYGDASSSVVKTFDMGGYDVEQNVHY